LADTENVIKKVYHKEQIDDLLAAINSSQQYQESKVSSFHAEFETLRDKNEVKLDELTKKNRMVSNDVSLTDFALN